MDKSRIIQQGEEAKFRIEINGFDMSEHPFSVTLTYGYRRTKVEIPKSKMIVGQDGKWYFVFDTEAMYGKVVAECTWRVPDTDLDDGYREEVDRQYLCFVVTVPFPRIICVPNTDDDEQVTYTRTEESDVSSEYTYMLTSDGETLLTSDNQLLMARN